jgi:hypothetical protein
MARINAVLKKVPFHRTMWKIFWGVVLVSVLVGITIWLVSADGKKARREQAIAKNPAIALPIEGQRATSSAPTLAEAKAMIATYTAKKGANPQFVLLAFDGSRSLTMWENSRAFAKEMAASGTPVYFTYFINAVYLLDPKFHSWFQSPGQKAGVSNIGFGTSQEDVLARIAEINAAYAEGHEIGSHNVGHFEGGNWTFDEWMGQFDLFDKIVSRAESMNAAYHIDVPLEDIVGFRAPDLSVNQEMYRALAAKHFLYDASKAGGGHSFPYKDQNGLWQLSLPTITVGPAYKHKGSKNPYQDRVLAMDYNLFLHDTKGKDLAKKETALWQTIHDQTLAALMNDFDEQYYKDGKTGVPGRRAPVYFASHFSTWNDGVYWEAMKDFAREVCGKPEVYCITYRDLAMWMEAKDVIKAAASSSLVEQI